MLFNFQAFIEELREKEETKEVVEKYEKFFGEITGDIKDQIWYKEYLEKFDYIPYEVPEELQPEFDWDILLKLIAGSFSNRCKMKYENEIPTFNIEVLSSNQVVDKNVGELWSFQILRLFEIYVEEAMNLQILISEDENEKEAIIRQREIRIDEWNKHLINLKTQNELDNLLND